MRNDEVKELCDEFNTDEGCEGCPIQKACAPQADDNFSVWSARVNAAALDVKKETN